MNCSNLFSGPLLIQTHCACIFRYFVFYICLITAMVLDVHSMLHSEKYCYVFLRIAVTVLYI